MIIILLIIMALITLIPQGLLKKYKLETTSVYDMRTLKVAKKMDKPVIKLEKEVYDNQEVLQTLGKEVCDILDKYIK